MINSYPEGWRQVRLRDVGQLDRGRSRHRPRYAKHLYGGKYPFIQTGDIKAANGRITTYSQTYNEVGLAQSRLWPAGTMCITIAANIAETAILTFPACFPDSVIGFIADETKCDVYFIEYMFRHLKTHIQLEATGSVQDNINLATFDRLYFPLPPLPEQREIARILGALDDKIDLNRRMNATLEATARALFQSWFVDFDPVRANAEGRLPDGMDAATAALFPAAFEESALGLTPTGWRFGTLGDLAKYNLWTLSTRDKLNTVEYIEISEVHQGEVGEIKLYERGGEPSRARRRLQHGDTVISTVRPDRGSYFLCFEPSPTLIASTGFAVFTPLTPNWSFVYCAFTIPAVFERLGALADGAAYPAVAPETIAGLPFVLPSENVVNAFHSICGVIFEKVAKNHQSSRTLAQTRDTLLPKLISGEMRVGDVEAKMEIS